MPGARNVGVAMDFSDSSNNALKWALDNLADKKDRIVLIHTIHYRDTTGQIQVSKETKSPLISLSQFRVKDASKIYGVEWNPVLLDMLDTASRQIELTIVSKIYYGDARQKLCDAVEDLQLDSLVMGSRGLGPLERMFLESVTDYIVANVACPVTIVKDSGFKP